MVTGDETWVYHYEQKSKEDSISTIIWDYKENIDSANKVGIVKMFHPGAESRFD